MLKNQKEEAPKLVSSLYCSGLTTEQAGKIYEQFYAKKWQKSYPPLKRYMHERYRFYFTYFKYEREIRGIYTANWIKSLNREYKRVINMRGAMPNP
ncbi:transposase [Odoribacter laneus]|uniref:transposase n=1 Tax=Odoribacter laneus TaxID=626933 RepID=UPI0039929606